MTSPRAKNRDSRVKVTLADGTTFYRPADSFRGKGKKRRPGSQRQRRPRDKAETFLQALHRLKMAIRDEDWARVARCEDAIDRILI